jgi:hypothetical protein
VEHGLAQSVALQSVPSRMATLVYINQPMTQVYQHRLNLCYRV